MTKPFLKVKSLSGLDVTPAQDGTTKSVSTTQGLRNYGNVRSVKFKITTSQPSILVFKDCCVGLLCYNDILHASVEKTVLVIHTCNWI